MKRAILLSMTIVFVFMLAGCGARYGVKRDKSGVFDTAELELNLLSTDTAPAFNFVVFNLKKYSSGGRVFYDDRQRLTPYVCQIPIIVEQKLGAYARAIQAHMQG